MARAPPRPPAPTLGSPPPTSPPSLAPHPTLRPRIPLCLGILIYSAHPPIPALPRVPTPVPPTLTSWIRDPSPPSLALLTYRVSYAPCPRPRVDPAGRAAPVLSGISACSPPVPPSPSCLEPSLHYHFSGSLSSETHSSSPSASCTGASTPSHTHAGVALQLPPTHHRLWAAHTPFPGLLSRPRDLLVTPRLLCPHCPLPTAQNQPTSGCRALDLPFSPPILCPFRTNTTVFLSLGLAPPSLQQATPGPCFTPPSPIAGASLLLHSWTSLIF